MLPLSSATRAANRRRSLVGLDPANGDCMWRNWEIVELILVPRVRPNCTGIYHRRGVIDVTTVYNLIAVLTLIVEHSWARIVSRT